jgi:hypothetical protein
MYAPIAAATGRFSRNSQEAVVTEVIVKDLSTILHSVRRSTLTKEQMFRLWRCAIKDDDRLVDDIIRQLYENIIAFDCRRAESVIELFVRRNAAAGCAFRSLLRDMRVTPTQPKTIKLAARTNRSDQGISQSAALAEGH